MKTKNVSLFSLLFLFVVLGCKKEFDVPPVKTLETTSKINIAQIKAKYTNINYRFKSDSSLYCVVIADEVSGNLYKDIYVRDVTGALHVKLIASGGLFIGDSIRINLQNCILNSYSNLIQLDSVDTEKSIVKLASGLNPQPVTMTIQQIIANTAATNSVQSKLVRINNVEFISSDINTPFADAIGKTSINKIIKSCDGTGTLTVRTSGYASFANQKTPSGNGTFIGIVGQFGTTMQMTIRNLNDLSLNGTLCSGTTPTSTPNNTFVLGAPVNTINETFSGVSDNAVFSSTGWINYNQNGSVKWKGDVTSTTYKCVYASAFKSTESNNTMWLITPPIVYSSTKTLSFKSGFGFWKAGHQNALMAYVSTNFDGTNFSTANWTAINNATYNNTGSGAYYTGSAGLISSGTINLNSISILNGYSGNFFIAWKYVGSDPSYTSNIYLDDIIVQ